MTKKRIVSVVQRSLESKTTLSTPKIEEIVDDIVDQNPQTPWWVVVLKVIAYAIGLVIAGYGTIGASCLFMVQFLHM